MYKGARDKRGNVTQNDVVRGRTDGRSVGRSAALNGINCTNVGALFIIV